MAIGSSPPPDDRFLDAEDTIRRVAGAGVLFDLTEDSEFVKLANAMLSVERGRLEEARALARKTLADFSTNELDDFWGALLKIERLPGVDDAGDFLGDSTFIERIKSYMESANGGISLESVRKAAEAGAGVPMRIGRSGHKLILLPLGRLTAAQAAGALKAASRIIPASAILEIGTGENINRKDPLAAYSPSVYTGHDPDEVGVSGPRWDSPSMMNNATADRWGRALEGTPFPGPGTPTELISGGCWHVPEMGFGHAATLTIGIEGVKALNRVKFSIHTGSWRIVIENEAGVILSDERIFANGWSEYEAVFPARRIDEIRVRITQTAQDSTGLFVKGFYCGARVDAQSRFEFLELEGTEGVGLPDEIETRDAGGMITGERGWVSAPAPSPNAERVLYLTLAGFPTRIEALEFATQTPGAIFSVAFSSDEKGDEDAYEDLNWSPLEGLYTLVNGRVRVAPFRGRHVRLTFTNLRPVVLKEFASDA
jgi:hypothetical protein